MEFRAERDFILDAAMQAGWSTHTSFVSNARKLNPGLPEKLLQRWARRFFRGKKPVLNPAPRLINGFTIGADPEFGLVNDRGNYIYASRLDFGIEKAFGSDMSGRQVELRVHPDRSCLRVVASILDTLRWMAATTDAGMYKWWSGAMTANDGNGGHIHFGMKRKKNLNCLDNMGDLCIKNYLDQEGHTLRKDATNYGKYGDIRKTSYGFEYRTLPTWLYSPWAAFLTLTFMKLSIYANVDYKTVNQLNILRRFRYIDDDAALCLAAMDMHGEPRFVNATKDFKMAWGLAEHRRNFNLYYIPATIPPAEESVRELHKYFLMGTKLTAELPEPTWKPSQLSQDIFPVTCDHKPGLVEVAGGLVSKDFKINVTQNHLPNTVTIYHSSYGPKCEKCDPKLLERLRHRLNSIGIELAESTTGIDRRSMIVALPISVAQRYVVNVKLADELRKIMLSGLLPIIKYEQLASGSVEFPKLFEKVVEINRPPKLVGRVEAVTAGQGRGINGQEVVNF